MRYLLLLTLPLLFLSADLSQASQKILVLQSLRIQPYEDAYRGLRSVVTGSVKRLVVSELEGIDLAKMVRDERPEVIVAIGTEAAAKIRKIKDVPIVYLMVLDSATIFSDEGNITGVNLQLPPERQLASLQSVIPKAKRVGLLFNSDRSATFVSRARAAARSMGMELVTRDVHSPREVPLALEGLRSDIDAFWMIPDTGVVSSETVEYLLLFSLRNKIPIMTFSDKYVEMGALLALEIDPADLGRQAGEMTKKIMGGARVASLPRSDPRSSVLTINTKIARKLGISLSDEVVSRSRVIR
jgi:putative ABC transport system substrate-binding protein